MDLVRMMMTDMETLDIPIHFIGMMAMFGTTVFQGFENGQAEEPFFSRSITDKEMSVFLKAQTESVNRFCSKTPELYYLLLEMMEYVDPERRDRFFLTAMESMEDEKEKDYINACNFMKKLREICELLKQYKYTCFPLNELNCLRVVGFQKKNEC